LFITNFKKQGDPLTAFDERLFCSLVDFAMVYNENDVRFTFKDGTEIKA
jgi:glutathionyl-hydroquinone reductase